VPLNPIVPIAPLPDCSDVPAGTACSREEGTTEPVPLPANTGCLNAGQTEVGDDECIEEDTPENRAEIVSQATEESTQPLTEEPTTVPQFGMEEDLDPDQLGLQQQDDGDIVQEDQIAEDSNDIGGTDTGSSEEDIDTDTSDGDDGGKSGSSDGDDKGGDDNGGRGDGGDGDDEEGGG
jgi:hypothetical protein